MARLTTDPTDPGLTHGVDAAPVAQAEAYLVLSEEERARGFTRPLRETYVHVGTQGPRYPLRDLTRAEAVRYASLGYQKFEEYPEGSAAVGSYWSRERLERVGRGCKGTTTMSRALAETYARLPSFYGATYCVGCQKHLPVAEFVWKRDGEVVGS